MEPTLGVDKGGDPSVIKPFEDDVKALRGMKPSEYKSRVQTMFTQLQQFIPDRFQGFEPLIVANDLLSTTTDMEGYKGKQIAQTEVGTINFDPVYEGQKYDGVFLAGKLKSSNEIAWHPVSSEEWKKGTSHLDDEGKATLRLIENKQAAELLIQNASMGDEEAMAKLSELGIDLSSPGLFKAEDENA